MKKDTLSYFHFLTSLLLDITYTSCFVVQLLGDFYEKVNKGEQRVWLKAKFGTKTSMRFCTDCGLAVLPGGGGGEEGEGEEGEGEEGDELAVHFFHPSAGL